MHGDEVGLAIEVLAARRRLHTQVAVALGAHEGVEGYDAHAEALCAVRDELADAPEAEDAQGLLVQLGARELRALPLATDQRHVRLRDVARERKQQGHRVLGRGDHVRLWRVGDHDPPARRRVHVDVVDADTRSPDDPQVCRPLDQLGRHLGRGADHDAVIGADPLGELLLAPLEPQLDVEVRAQKLHPRVADLLLDQHLQALPVGAGDDAGGGCWRARAGVRRVRAHGASLSTTQSTQVVSACTSAGSVAGNIAIRS